LINFHLWVSKQGEEWILFGCCSQRGFFRLQVVFLRRWVFADLGGFLICLGFCLWRSQLNQRLRLLEWWFFLWGSWRRFVFHLWVSKQGEEWILFGCCSQRGFFRLQVVFLRRWVFADLGGFLICLGFCLWRSQLNQRLRLLEWWFFLWGSWRRFAFFNDYILLREDLLLLIILIISIMVIQIFHSCQ
jgi:hypothetical protein